MSGTCRQKQPNKGSSIAHRHPPWCKFLGSSKIDGVGRVSPKVLGLHFSLSLLSFSFEPRSLAPFSLLLLATACSGNLPRSSGYLLTGRKGTSWRTVLPTAVLLAFLLAFLSAISLLALSSRQQVSESFTRGPLQHTVELKGGTSLGSLALLASLYFLPIYRCLPYGSAMCFSCLNTSVSTLAMGFVKKFLGLVLTLPISFLDTFFAFQGFCSMQTYELLVMVRYTEAGVNSRSCCFERVCIF